MRIAVRALIVALWLVLLAPFDYSQAQYRQHGPALLNDLTVTPGATLPQDTKDVLCSPSFHTGTVRAVSEATKQQACREYGVDRAHCTGKLYEIDHLISLELGGSNDITNLWPQSYLPTPGAHEKDKVENWLHRQVCSGEINPVPQRPRMQSHRTGTRSIWGCRMQKKPGKTRKRRMLSRAAILPERQGRCSDGSYTYSQSSRGACSHHGGVSEWF